MMQIDLETTTQSVDLNLLELSNLKFYQVLQMNLLHIILEQVSLKRQVQIHLHGNCLQDHIKYSVVLNHGGIDNLIKMTKVYQKIALQQRL
ncbi:MAG: hypothetical protein CMJ25_06445 [Phycisphaerae bacterium]|nr:hypothetical protein [Phycisphaerae bacterium]